MATHLERKIGDRAVLLHDRKYGRANLDHLVVASSGVWVIDAKSYAGRLEHRNLGRWLGPADFRLYVAGATRPSWPLPRARGGEVDAKLVGLPLAQGWVTAREDLEITRQVRATLRG